MGLAGARRDFRPLSTIRLMPYCSGMPEDSAAEIASAPELADTSESEQMYLITIAREVEDGNDGPVRLARIAAALDVSVPSANEMIRKLDARSFVTYEPYHGVRLSDSGKAVADRVLRTRRLWATFLVDHLGFSPTEADDQACHLEHATSHDATERLAAYLGNPDAGPLGHPIPAAEGFSHPAPGQRLREATVGSTVEIAAVTGPEAVLAFLSAEGIVAGARLRLTAVGASGLLVEISDRPIHLTDVVAAAVEVHRIDGQRSP